MSEKQQQLIFDKGITNVPNDALCSDNALEENIGMIYEDGENKVIQAPSEENITWGSYKVLYIHKYNDQKRYITADLRITPTPGLYLGWAESIQGELVVVQNFDIPDVDDKIFITSVGKTLIISAPDGLHYFLWKENTYKSLGQNIPTQKVTFRLEQASSITRLPDSAASSSLECEFCIEDGIRVKTNKIEDYNNLVLGLYAKNKKVISQAKRFCNPFLVRTALRLYDDSYVHISQPVLMMPSVTGNSVFKTTVHPSGEDVATMDTYFRELKYRNESFAEYATGVGPFFEDWTDVVKDIVIFISDEVDLYDVSVDQNRNFTRSTTQVIDGIYSTGAGVENAYHLNNKAGYLALVKKDAKEVIDELMAKSTFYKLCSIGLFEYSTSSSEKIDDKVSKHYLENIVTQESLETDDYFSFSTLYADTLFSYNGRLNLANVRRSVFEGFDYFFPCMGFDQTSAIGTGYTGYCRFYVTIETDSGSKIVKHEAYAPYFQGLYFYYPDSRAKHVQIFREYGSSHSESGSNPYHRLLDAKLKEHDGLHGAFYADENLILKISQQQEAHETYNTTATEPEENVELETLPSYIITSDVNNPYVFRAEGYNKVGNGKIMGLSTQTQALSQGQFGQFPLIVFASDGIWAMTVDDTGLYSSIHPLSRDVCNNPKSITQTDGAVFFSTEKGLMVIAGSQVKCVSEQLSGKENTSYQVANMGNFNAFLSTCFIAYDYRDSLLWIFSTVNIEYCYVYSIKSGTFSKYHFHCNYALNDYPDFLLVQGGGGRCCYSLINRPNVNLDTRTYSGTMITRPLKLENALALKSIMQIKHITHFTPYSVTNNNVTTTQQGTLTLRIFASNNLTDWVEISSLKSVPWKYYRFRYDFANLRAVDTFSGTLLITQERRINKLR